MDNNYKKTGRDGASRATRKVSNYVDAGALPVRVATAIGGAALWGLLPIRLAERFIRWVTSS
jgi:hypothetical protein